jgi:RNA recognition motif-containing protein
MEVKLRVGNLADSTTEQELRQLFSQAGTVTSVRILAARASGQSSAFANVTMATQAEAQKAIDQFHEFRLADRPLTVSLARSRAAPAGDQGRLGAFGPADRGANGSPPKPGKARGGYKGELGAFGSGKSAPTPARRRGRSQRR